MSQRVRVGNPNGKMFEVSENEQVLMEVVIDLIGMVEDRAEILSVRGNQNCVTPVSKEVLESVHDLSVVGLV